MQFYLTIILPLTLVCTTLILLCLNLKFKWIRNILILKNINTVFIFSSIILMIYCFNIKSIFSTEDFNKYYYFIFNIRNTMIYVLCSYIMAVVIIKSQKKIPSN
jgi:hypothetical protein